MNYNQQMLTYLDDDVKSGKVKSFAYVHRCDNLFHDNYKYDYIRTISVDRDTILKNKGSWSIYGMVYQFNGQDMYKNIMEFEMLTGYKVEFVIDDYTDIWSDHTKWKLSDLETGKVVYDRSAE